MYYRIYYSFYLLIKRLGEDIIPRYSAVLLMSILLSLNLATLIGGVCIIMKKIILVDHPKVMYGVGIALVSFNTCLIFWKKRYLKIEAKMEQRSKVQRTRDDLLAIVYVFLSVALLLLLILYLEHNPITRTGIQSG